MDRDEAIRLLKGGPEGIREWNGRRRAGEEIPNLRGANLSEANLRGAILHRANLRGANLGEADLGEAILHRANLGGANLGEAELRGANLREADLRAADLRDALLWGANLIEANLDGANLRGANLHRANLSKANLDRAVLSGADVSRAICVSTSFGNVDLSEANGLDFVEHEGPSTIGIDTLFLSKGKIREAFLRGCGLTPWEILSANLYRPELTPAGLSDLQYQIFDAWTKGRSMINGCFVSYSHSNAKFVDKLRDRLYAEGVNVWLDRHDMVAGTMQDQVWRAIQLHHVVILVLSEDSVKSDWVENELDMARNKEKAEGRAVLCPVALDDAWKAKVDAKGSPGDPSRQLWRTLHQKLVLDFSGWTTKAFDEAFQKLLRGLNTNYGPR
jgi:uncharacterized protein YjbI with pentapeptide repeats